MGMDTIVKSSFCSTAFLLLQRFNSVLLRESFLQMLGVTNDISDKLSVSDHVQNIARLCAQSVHAIRTVRAHGMCQEGTHSS